jgi:hypothetical protein
LIARRKEKDPLSRGHHGSDPLGVGGWYHVTK